MIGIEERTRPLVLVVDDDRIERYLHRQALERAGFAIVEATNGTMALAAFADARPDIVVLDVVMPDMDGFAVCEAVRAMPGGRHTPILMATYRDDLASIDRAYRVGATDFVGKPINWAVLPHRLRYMLRADDNFRRLRISERRLAEAQRIAGLGNFRWMPGSAAIECSAEVLRILGLDGGRLSARALLRRIPADDRAIVIRAVREALAGAPIALDHRVLTRDGAVRSLSLRAELSSAADGPRFLQGSCQDITERKRFERELAIARDEALAASAAKTAFLAAMSHELRTPLNAIIGFSELIAGEVFGPVAQPKYAEFAEAIHKAGGRMLEVVVDMLTIARLEAGRFELHFETVDLHATAAAAAEEFRSSEIGSSRQVSVERSGEGLLIRADDRAVREMLAKLLSNAAKFSPPGSVIRLTSARTEDGWARVVVSDAGIGMTAQEAELAVRTFAQVDTRLERRYEGAGLGLSIVNRLIERHGGRLVIVSAPQQGTRVSLDFPIAARR
ncbi:MAG TPA: hybrid sensor histidine kinase/response regulator, partial [Stellaceae bacterium]|nr:hybrid sensor histidine kinase/response regulator [Stellaceae bacterium]